jgi:hypothetical protein
MFFPDDVVRVATLSESIASEVAKVILQAVTSDNLDFRYAVGKDAVMTLESRKSMSDREFQDMIKKGINL